MRSALVASLLAAAVLTPGSITARASAPGPIIHSSANPGRIAPIDIADDGLGIAGVDIGHAGSSKQSRMTYLNSLIQETQATVWARCGEILKGKQASTDTAAFCRDVLPEQSPPFPPSQPTSTRTLLAWSIGRKYRQPAGARAIAGPRSRCDQALRPRNVLVVRRQGV